mmetsp:Transcript_8410/g.21521  ORF Transcript_8410/g.21521 Transcript_8410/m.21521 type:complete len:204 (-) Transcript_8410:936-1547(-)
MRNQHIALIRGAARGAWPCGRCRRACITNGAWQSRRAHPRWADSLDRSGLQGPRLQRGRRWQRDGLRHLPARWRRCGSSGSGSDGLVESIGRGVLAIHSKDELRLEVLQKSRGHRILHERFRIVEDRVFVMSKNHRHLVRLLVDEVMVLYPHIVGQILGQVRGSHDMDHAAQPGPEQILRLIDDFRVWYTWCSLVRQGHDFHP